MKILSLPEETRALTGATHKVIVGFADVQAIGANAAGTVQLLPKTGNLPLGSMVEVIGTNLTTKFDSAADAGITSLTIQLGDGGSAARYLAAQELSVDGSFVLYKAGNGTKFAYTTNDKVLATFTAANGGTPTCAEIDSGEIEVYLRVVDLVALQRPR